MSDTKQLTVKLALQSSSYTQQIKSINTSNKQLKSEFEALNSTSKDYQNTLEGKAAKIKMVSSTLDNAKQKVSIYETQVSKCKDTLDKATTAYDTQKKKVDELQRELDDAKDTYGENSDEVQRLEEELTQAEKALDRNRSAVTNADNALGRMETSLNDAQREVNTLENELGDLEGELKDLSSEADNAGNSLSNFGSNLEKGGSTLQSAGSAVSGFSSSMLDIGKTSVDTAREFENAMSQVGATMGLTADEIAAGSEDFNMLSDKAREMGSQTSFSASQAAEALNYLALAGLDATESCELLPKVLSLAQAGGIELAEASDMVTDAMSALGDKAGTSSEFVDRMAKASQKSNTSVAQLGNAILTVGGTAKSLAGDTRELNTALGILGDNGVKGAEGGTALRNIILSLSSPTDVASKKIEELGLQVFDADGNMRAMDEILFDLNDSLKDLTGEAQTKAISTIFNKTDLKSVNALLANVTTSTKGVNEALADLGVNTDDISEGLNEMALAFDINTKESDFVAEAMDKLGLTTEQAEVAYSELMWAVENNESRWSELYGYIDESDGAASDMAETMKANLQGGLEGLSSALEGAYITIGNLFLPAIKWATSAITDLLSWFNNADESVQILVGAFVAFGAALAPILTITGGLMIFLNSAMTAFASLSATVSAAGGMMSFFSASIAPVLVAVGSVIAVVVAVALAIKENWDGIKDATQKLVERCSPYFDDLKDAFKNLWETAKSIWETVGQPIFKILGEVIEVAIRTSIPIIKMLLIQFTAVVNGISTIWNVVGRPVFSLIVTVIQTMWNVVKPILLAFSDVFSSMVNVIRKLVNSLFKPAFDSMSNAVKSMWNSVQKSLNSFQKGVQNVMKTVLSPVKEVIKWFDKLANTVGKVSKSVVGKVQSMFSGHSLDDEFGIAVASDDSNGVVALSGSYYTRSTPLAETYGQLSNTLSTANGYMASSTPSNVDGMFKRMLELMTLQTQLLEDRQEVVVNVGGTELKQDFYDYTVKRLNTRSKLLKGF